MSACSRSSPTWWRRRKFAHAADAWSQPASPRPFWRAWSSSCGPAGCRCPSSARGEMYQSFYDLQEMPFELTPDPKDLYLSRQHREALSNLEYGLLSSKGITVLTGEAGTG